MPQPPEIIGPWFLWKLLIDERHQRHGHGREVVRLVMDLVREAGADDLLVSYVPEGEGGPAPFYERLGFVPTGEVDGSARLMRMDATGNGQHHKRMKALAAFSASTFDTEFPSPFGSAIYDERTGVLVAQAYDTVMKMCDPTNHAEINAIRDAAREFQRLSLRGCTLYSTCEPCPMCISACIWAEIDTVVFGASTLEDANLYWPQASDLPPQELVAHMLLEPRCRLIPHVGRSLCRNLFTRCDEVRKERGLQLPPHRPGYG